MFHLRDAFYTHIDIYRYSNIDLNKILPSNLHLHSHDICFVNVFNSFIPVITLNTLRFKSSALFGKHAILDKLLIVLQLPNHLFNLTVNG